MKVYIGPYTHWIGPYQIADWLEHFCVLERDRYRIGKWLANTWVKDFCEWIESKRSRNMYIHIDGYDAWNADDTMARIILPVMRKVKETKHGYGFIDDVDVPEEIRSTNASPKENEWDWDDNAEKRYEWVLDEIIWSFEQILEPNAEDQFHTGVIDHVWEPCENSNLSQLGHGPKHTHEFDIDGYKVWSKRIDNGTTLFGKYFRTFWN